MADYQDIRGLRVKYLSADPSTTTTGEVWYNSTSGTLKATVMSSAAWSSGGALNGGRRLQGNAGGKDAGLTFGGYSPSPEMLDTSEEYDGSSWTASNTLNTGRYGLRGFGIQTAAVAVGGQVPGGQTTAAENYDGSTWTNTGAMSIAREEATVFGIQAAGVACGGFNSTTNVPETEEFNGSTWSSNPNNLNTTSYAGMSAGTLTAGVRAGGVNPYPSGTKITVTEEFDGTNWTGGGTLVEAVSHAAPSKNGTQTAWQFAGGRNAGGIIATTFAYDGSTWTTSPATLGSAKTEFDGGGTVSGAGAHLVCGGALPPAGATTTEEFTASVAETQTLTTS
jgi:hypothetical protein